LFDLLEALAKLKRKDQNLKPITSRLVRRFFNFIVGTFGVVPCAMFAGFFIVVMK